MNKVEDTHIYCFGQFEHANRPASPAYKDGIVLPPKQAKRGKFLKVCAYVYSTLLYILIWALIPNLC